MKNLWKWFLPAALAAVSLPLCGAPGDVIASWDFRSPDALKGKFPLTVRKNSVVNARGLVNDGTDPAVPGGAMTVKTHPELTPLGPFALDVTFSLDGDYRRPDKVNAVLWDNKYVPSPNDKQRQYHNGFMLYLRPVGDDRYRPVAAFGCGDRSYSVSGRELKLTPGTEYTLQMRYAPGGSVRFLLDGRAAGSAPAPADAPAPAVRATVLGDRVGATYWPLGGVVHKVVLREDQSAEVKPGDVLACWDFSCPETLDGDFPVQLRGKSAVVDGRLEIPVGAASEPGGGRTAPAPGLTPRGAFSVEAVFVLNGAERQDKIKNRVLFDTKYVPLPDANQQRYHKGFLFYLIELGNGQYRPCAALGFGDKSVSVSGSAVELAPNMEHTAVMTFSATGKVEFTMDGKPAGGGSVPAGPLAPSELGAALGDRLGAGFWPLGGRLLRVTVKAAEFTPHAFVPDPARRRVFERGESAPKLHLELWNFSEKSLPALTVQGEVAGRKLPAIAVSGVPAGGKTSLACPLEAWLLPGEYRLSLTAHDAPGAPVVRGTVDFTVVPAYGDFMPVVLWGGANSKVVKDLGFTHQIVSLLPNSGSWHDSMAPAVVARLDRFLKDGLYAYVHIRDQKPSGQFARHVRTGRDGKPYGRVNLEASHPEVRREFVELVSAAAAAVGDHPAWDSALLNSEVRDGTEPSFGSGVEPAAFRKFAGFDIPESVQGKYPAAYQGRAAFPWDRVIPDNDPELLFFRWFWREGDGWNPLNTLLTETLHKFIKHHFFTFYDPVTRVPPLWGSGGKTDMVSQWTYVYPDPIKIGQAADEVIAMAQGTPGQKTACMTQAIWYRNQTAPQNLKVANPPDWMGYEPDAKFVTIAPDALREAFWSKVSRRIDAIMYHGTGSLIERSATHQYRYTNPESKGVLRDLANTVVKPLGPVLTKVPERAPEVAILESFTGSIYGARHFPMGWSNKWVADLHLALQWAHFQPVILYDQHILTDYYKTLPKVLFLPGLEVVTESMLNKLRQYQKQGVILIGDEFTAPAIMPDYRIRSVARTAGDPAGSKKALQKLGREIAAMLKDHYRSPMAADSQELVIRRRGSDAADYVFVLNDHRTFGDYLGQWGLVMEKGLPQSGTVTVGHGAVKGYDLVKHTEIPLRHDAGGVSFDVALGPGDGMLVLLLDRAIQTVAVTIPELRRGEPYSVTVKILDKDGRPVPAILPVEVTLTASDGATLPGSGFYAARNGELTIPEVAAPNMAPGKVRVAARCLASGLAAVRETVAR